MIKRDIHVSDVTPFDPKPMCNMIEPDQRYVDLLVDRGNIPPLDGAVPEQTDYYSLGAPEYTRRHWTGTATSILLLLISVGIVVGLFFLSGALYRAAFS
mgnify:CR=1 FL=1